MNGYAHMSDKDGQVHVRMIADGKVYAEFDLSEVSPVDVYYEGRFQCRAELTPEGIVFTDAHRPADENKFPFKLWLAEEEEEGLGNTWGAGNT